MARKPFYEADGVSLYCGDCREVLSELAEKSVNCCVTSPPYWGLRDYGTGRWDGGDQGCEHSIGNQVQDSKATGAITTGVRPGCDASKCRKCGAKRIDQQIGLEKSPQLYIAKMVDVFRGVRRVLSEDGTVWIVIGDSYSPDGKSGGSGGCKNYTSVEGGHDRSGDRLSGLPNKNLMMIPARLAIALQEDGWYLRSEVIWHKPNGMPSSVADRPTCNHEHVFLLSKSPNYYYDYMAIREKDTSDSGGACFGAAGKAGPGSRRMDDDENESIRDGWRNKRSVWTINTAPSAVKHFAAYPPALIKPMILAGCPSHICSKCGTAMSTLRIIDNTKRCKSCGADLLEAGAITSGTVLDPFAGTFTTGAVAREQGKKCIGIELSEEYAGYAVDRMRQGVLFGVTP